MLGLMSPLIWRPISGGVTVAAVKQGFVVAGGANTIDMPANRHDTLVLAYTVAGSDDPNIAPTIGGFTSLESQTNTDDPRQRLSYAFGPGATAVLTTNSLTRNVAYILYSFAGAKLAEAPDADMSSETGGSTGPNPPSRTPTEDGSEIVIFGAVVNSTTTTGWAAPSGYSNLLVQSAGDTLSQNVVIMSARRNLATAAAEDPGNFTPTNTDHWGAATAVIKPA